MILKTRIRQLEAREADYRAALEACIRAMEGGQFCSAFRPAMDGARALLAPANQNDDRTPASADAGPS